MTLCCDLCLVTLLMVVVGYFWLAKLHADQKQQQYQSALLLGITTKKHALSKELKFPFFSPLTQPFGIYGTGVSAKHKQNQFPSSCG